MKLKNWTINILSAIEYYKGNLVSSNGTLATEESQNGKRKTFIIRADYTISTDLGNL